MGNRCTGRCCKSFPLNRTLGWLKDNAARGDVESAKIVDMVIPIGDAPEGHPLYGQPLYTCKHWDAASGNCMNYENRPALCSDYPYNDPCSYSECEWTAARHGLYPPDKPGQTPAGVYAERVKTKRDGIAAGTYRVHLPMVDHRRLTETLTIDKLKGCLTGPPDWNFGKPKTPEERRLETAGDCVVSTPAQPCRACKHVHPGEECGRCGCDRRFAIRCHCPHGGPTYLSIDTLFCMRCHGLVSTDLTNAPAPAPGLGARAFPAGDCPSVYSHGPNHVGVQCGLKIPHATHRGYEPLNVPGFASTYVERTWQ